MWEMTPSWIHLTPDAVLGGRVGDGGQPSSTLFRIDRETLELTGVVFPAPDWEPVVIGPGGLAPTTAEDWRLAPDDVSVDDLVTTGPDATGPDAVGTNVTSTIGVVRVDADTGRACAAPAEARVTRVAAVSLPGEGVAGPGARKAAGTCGVAGPAGVAGAGCAGTCA